MSVSGEAGFRQSDPETDSPVRAVLAIAAFTVVMLAVSWISIILPRELNRLAPVWPANAIAMTVLLVQPRRRWAGWLTAAWIGNMLANLLVHDPPGPTLILSSANLIEVLASASLLRWWVGPRIDVSRIGDLLRLALVAGVLSPAFGAFSSAVMVNALQGESALVRFVAWTAGDGLGAVIVAPVLLTLFELKKHLAATPIKPMGWLALAILAATTALVFSVRLPLGFLILPPMLLVVFQLELLGAALGVVIVLVIGAVLTVSGFGPMAQHTMSVVQIALASQLFMAAMILTSFPTAAVLAQRRRLQAEVGANAARTAELLRRIRLAEDVGGVGYWRLDAGGVRTWSESTLRMFAIPTGSVLDNAALASRVHPDDLAETLRLRDRAIAFGEDYSHQLRLVWPDGQVRHLLVKAASERTGRPDGAVFGAIIDITELKQAEAEVNAAREAAEAAARVKSEFLANMSHELRTPLTSVVGFTRLALEQPDLTETSRGYIAKASNAGSALLSTVNDILDFSKLESGQLQIRLEPTDPAALCRETLELFSERAAEKGLSLCFVAGALPAWLSIDPDRLRQLLLNLVGNAVKFAEVGEVALSVDWSAQDQRLSVSVRDQGPGVALAQQPLLFRRFSQVDGSSTRRHGGTGLGLAICLGLVDAMGGRIGVESELGHGARFFFDIPAPLAAAPAGEDDAPPDDAPIFPVGARILVADDHPANRELVRAVLEPLGATVSEAADGAEAVALAARQAFDLILMDLRMPELDGLAAMKAIRAGAGPNRDAPILAFSAGADAPTGEARRQAGFDGDLSKPLLPAELVFAVARHARAADKDAPAALAAG
jgi:signal transduction histidine kinase/ActR/RegA family two-component response regulator